MDRNEDVKEERNIRDRKGRREGRKKGKKEKEKGRNRRERKIEQVIA